MRKRVMALNESDITPWVKKEITGLKDQMEPRELARKFSRSMDVLSHKHDNLRTLARAVQEELIAEEGHEQRYMRITFETESGVVDLELNRLQAHKVVALLRDLAVRELNDCCLKAQKTWFFGVSQIVNKATLPEGEEGTIDEHVGVGSDFM